MLEILNNRIFPLEPGSTWIDILTVFLIIFPFVLVLCFAGRWAADTHRPGTFFTLVIMVLYMIMQALIRLGTGGGHTAILDPDNSWLVQIFGQDWGFLFINLALFGSFIWQLYEERKTEARSDKYDELVRKLKDYEQKGNQQDD
jgi:hypothetical protein